MAIISKIRQRSWILLTFIALAMLIFLVQAALESPSNSLRGGKKNSVGKINGHNISATEYSQQVTDYEDGLKLINPQIQVDDEMRSQIRDEVWYNTAMQAILGKTLKSLGIGVTLQEIGQLMTSKKAHPLAQRLLMQLGAVDQGTGQIDEAKAREIMTNIDKYDPDGTNNLRQTIQQIETLVKEETIKSKYLNLVAKSYYLPKFLVKDIVKSNQSATINYLEVPYTSLDDAKYKVTDKEIQEYIDKHKKQYEQKATRTLDMVVFDILPSKDDSSEALTRIEKLRTEYDKDPNDSAFLARNSIQGPNDLYFSLDELQQAGRDMDKLNSIATGATSDIYITNGAYVFSKVINRRVAPDTVRAAHILLSLGDGSDEAKAAANQLADSLIQVLASGKANFGDVAFQNTKDEGTKQKGGDLGYFGRNTMVKPFNDKVFYGMVPGQIAKVESQFGLHIILLIDARSPKQLVQVVDFVQPILPGKETQKKVYNEAVAFQQNNNTADKFDKAIKTKNALRSITVQQNDVNVQNLGAARKVVQWAFEQEAADKIDFFDLSDKFVVAKLDKITAEGLATVADVKDEVSYILINDKKAKDITTQLNSASKGTTDLNAIATKVKDAAVNSDVAVRFSSGFLGSSGNEPVAVGAAFGVKENKLSTPVKGNMGVFIVQPTTFGEVPATDKEQIANYQKQFTTNYANQMQFQQLLNAILKNAKVEDLRYTVY
ncbi:MAG: peptidylprolyl isomerase [Chitinophagales bacterium]